MVVVIELLRVVIIPFSLQLAVAGAITIVSIIAIVSFVIIFRVIFGVIAIIFLFVI